MGAMVYFIAGLLRPLFWIVVLGLILWAVRKFLPPRWERILFRKLF